MKLPRFLRIGAAPSSHTYAATTLNAAPVRRGLQLPKTDSGWQGQAWQYYEVVPEMRQVVEHRANAVSKVKIQVAKLGEDGDPEVLDTPETRRFLDWLFGGREQHAAHLALLAQQGTVVGESIVVVAKGKPNPDGTTGPEQWFTVAPDQVDAGQMAGPSGYVTVKSPVDGQAMRFSTPEGAGDSVRLIRLWEAHPRNQWEANSPTRGGIATLDTIAHLNASIKSAALSRLIGGGIYFMPQEMNLPQPTTDDGPGISAYDKFKNDMYEAAGTAIQNPASAEAQLPIFAWVPGESLKNLQPKPVDFSTDFDQRVGDLLDKEIRRYAQGQPMPTEKVVGEGGGNHWSDWQLSEEDLKMDIAPLTERFLSALTAQILQPLLGPDVFLHPDYTQLVTRPDRTPEAIQLFDAEIITREEAREMSGFPEEFDGELKQRQLPAGDTQEDTPTDNLRPEIPNRQPIREGDTTMAVAPDRFVQDLLRETGKKMLMSAPRCDRGAMMSVPEHERHLRFDGAFAAFQAVAPKVVERYKGVVPPGGLAAGVGIAQLAVTNGRPHG